MATPDHAPKPYVAWLALVFSLSSLGWSVYEFTHGQILAAVKDGCLGVGFLFVSWVIWPARR